VAVLWTKDGKVSAIGRKDGANVVAIRQIHESSIGKIELLVGIIVEQTGDALGVVGVQLDQANPAVTNPL
jgi:hypothetical protein